jgi:tetratricopeptide (TPR) repeat protein
MRRRSAILCVSFALIASVLLSGCQGTVDWYERGMQYYRQEQFEKALAMFDKAIEENHANYAALLARGDALFNLQSYLEAVRSFEQAPWSQVGSHKEAREAVDKALEANQSDASLWTLKGDFLRQRSGQDPALFCYERALQINPKSYGAWSGKYYSLRNAGRLQEAEAWRNMGIDAGVL